MTQDQHQETNLRQDSKSIGKQIFSAIKDMDVSGLAKRAAYDILFSLAPLLIFVTALAGWITQIVNADQPNPAEPVLQWMTDNLPSEAANFLKEPIATALKTSPGFLLSFGAVLALWSAKNALSTIIIGLNASYGVDDSRSWIHRTLAAIGLTIALAAMLGIAGITYVLGTDIGQDIADGLGLGSVFATASIWLRWPLIAVVVILAVAMIHRFGPNVEADLKWFLPGAAFTVIGWVIATYGLSIYFNISGGYSEAYGAFGAVLAFVFWLWVMSLVVLLGGVVNMVVQKELPQARQNVDDRDDEKNDNEDVLQAGQT